MDMVGLATCDQVDSSPIYLHSQVRVDGIEDEDLRRFETLLNKKSSSVIAALMFSPQSADCNSTTFATN